MAVARRNRRSLPVRVLLRVYRTATGESAKALAYRAFQRLPIKPGTVVFESQLGLQYSDSPKYVHEALRELRPDLSVIWAYAENPAGFPKTAQLVKRKSFAYYHALARAQYWVDNQGFPRVVTKRKGTTYLQTWHGTPLKLMGWDEPSLAALPPTERRAHQAMIDRWDHLVVPNEFFVDTFVRSYGYDGDLIRSGTPATTSSSPATTPTRSARCGSDSVAAGPPDRALRADLPGRPSPVE